MWTIIYFFFLKQTAHKISGTMRIICTTIPRCERNKTRAVVWDTRRRVATDANIFGCVQFCTSGILSKMRVFPNSRGGTTSKRDWDRQTDRQSLPRDGRLRVCAPARAVRNGCDGGGGFSLLLDSHASYYYYKTKSNLFERGRRSRVNKLAVKTE